MKIHVFREKNKERKIEKTLDSVQYTIANPSFSRQFTDLDS